MLVLIFKAAAMMRAQRLLIPVHRLRISLLVDQPKADRIADAAGGKRIGKAVQIGVQRLRPLLAFEITNAQIIACLHLILDPAICV